MKPLAILLIIAFALTACSGSSVNTVPVVSDTLPPVTLNTPIASIYALSDATPAGTSSAGAVLPLFAIPTIATNYGALTLLGWGTKDAAGNIQSLQEIAVYDSGAPTQAVSLFFDASGHLSSLLDQPTGYSVILSSPSTTQATATLCDPSLNAVASITVTPDANGNPQGQVVTGGTCAIGNPFALAPAAKERAAADTAVRTNLGNLGNLAQLITAGSYVAGLGFAVGAIVKFKQHKDNPTQSPISTPIALLFISAALMFIPSVFKSAGGTLFGNEATAISTDGIAAFVTPP